ncbi:MAG: branched-chain amino acid ABC transporter permease [Acidobacteria bacterium]|nr:branched-chain amino acid ABC transporter permease [Acidobacteriota bacterium]
MSVATARASAFPIPRSVGGAVGARRQMAVSGAALAVAAVAIPALAGSYWTFVASYFLIYALIGLSLILLMGFVGQISLMAGTVVGIGAFTSAAVENHFGWPFWASVLAATAATLPFSLAVGFPALRLRGLYLAIATLAFGRLIEELLFRGWPWFSGGFAGVAVRRPSLGISFASDARYFWLVLAFFAAVVAFVYNFSRSRIGRAMRATRDNELAAQSMGVNIVKYKMMAFFLSGAVAGVAGALQIHLVKSATLDGYGFYLSFIVFIMVVIGGARSIWGAVLGGWFMIVQTELLRGVEWLTRYTDIGIGVGVLWVVLSNPEGLAGFFRDRWAWVREKPRWRAAVAALFAAANVATFWLLIHYGQRGGA